MLKVPADSKVGWFRHPRVQYRRTDASPGPLSGKAVPDGSYLSEASKYIRFYGEM